MALLKYILILSVLLCVSTVNTDDTMAWRDHYKLSWLNFKGQPEPNSTAVAVTASGITFGYSLKRIDNKIVSFNANVEAHFYPEKSWYIKDRADAYVLAHEQLHFDITELHVRKFRKQIAQLKVSPHIQQDLQKLHRDINKALADMQNRYDTETNNSIDKETQSKWIRFINEELKRYNTYKSKD